MTMLNRNEPESLTNDIINTIGLNYISVYPRASLTHSSHSVAHALADYNADVDSRDKWLFLAKQYMELNSTGKTGQLSYAIRSLFTEAFPQLSHHYCNNMCPIREAERFVYEPINRYYNEKLFQLVRSIFNKKIFDDRPAAAFQLSASSPINTANLYPLLVSTEKSEEAPALAKLTK